MHPTVVSLMMVPIAVMLMFMMFDLARIHLVRGQLLTAADAGSLAGAMTAEAEPVYVYEAVYDEEGSLVELKAVTVGYSIEIDPEKAEAAARESVLRNVSGPLRAQRDMGLLDFEVSSSPADDDFDGSVVGEGDEYRVSLKAKLKLLLAGPLARLYGVDDRDKGIGAVGTAEAVYDG